ncbi:beta strand repeat-containing protein [Methylobacterium sp. CM6247]
MSTLQPGTPWNPDGTPTAPSILPTHGAVQVLAVANQAQLAAAIETVNASPGNYAIHVTADISLNADLPALNQPLGVVRIDGEGHVLDGADTYRGLMVDDTQALLKDLTIQDAVAQGGAGGIGKAGGGGGAGLGGGVLAVNHATIALDDVSFTNDAATGGQGGAREAGALLGSAGYGGGGGMGGAGGAGSAWHSSVGGVFGDIGQHLNPLVQADEDDGRDGSSGGGGGLGIAATGSASGPGGRSSILTGADGGLGLDDGTSANNDAAGVGGGLGANGVQGGWGGGGAGSAGDGDSGDVGGNGGYGGGGGGGGGAAGYGGGGGGGGGAVGIMGVDQGQAGFGGGAGAREGGGGGAGLGGGAFADGTSTISIEGGSFTGDTATGGQGASGGGSGQGYGNSIFLSGNQVLTAFAKPGETTTLGGGISDQSGVHDPSGQGGAAVVMAVGGGTVAITEENALSGGIVIGDGTTLELAVSGAAGATSAIAFGDTGDGATLRVDAPALPAGGLLVTGLRDMQTGDRVDFAGLAGATQVTVGTVGGAMATDGQTATQVTASNGAQSESVLIEGLNAGATFAVASDGQGGSTLTMTQAMPAPTGLVETTAADGSPVVSGQAQAGSSVTLYQVQAQAGILLQLGTATATSNGTFSLSPDTLPDAGAGPIAALSADASGNRSALSAALALPAGTGGTPPATDASFGTPTLGSIVLRVGTEAQLTAAIDQANAGTTPGPLAIEFTNDITLMGANDLPVLQGSSPVTILGQGHTLDGNDFVRGLMVLGGNAAIEDLTIADTVASGGMGGIGASGGGGGAGLGGGLMVAGGANVLLADVHFSNDAAQGGEGGISGAYGEGYGGGGGLGGSGGNTASSLVGLSGGGGGIGAQAVGGNGIDAATGSQGTAGPITGAPSDAGIGAHGSVAGGGGDGGSAIWQGGAGAGGGIYGLSGADTSEGGEGSTGGWGGGGGGNNTYGGNGGFGGGGGGSQTQGGYGGFGGGGGGGAPLLSGTGAPGGFGGGAGGDGTNNPQSDGGGGGLGAGGAVFVEQGSSLTVVNSGSTGDTVAGGQGQNGGGDGQAYGAGWFIQGNQAITLGALTGQTTTINDVISDETGSHDASGATGAGTVIAAGPGTVALEVQNTYTGGTVIDGGTLELGAAGAAGTGDITFATGSVGTLKVDAAVTRSGTLLNGISGLAAGDAIDLAGVAYQQGAMTQAIGAPGSAPTAAGGMAASQVLIGNGTDHAVLAIEGLAPQAALTLASDGQGGTLVSLAQPAGTASADSSAVAAATPGGADAAPATELFTLPPGQISSLGTGDPRNAVNSMLFQASSPPGVAVPVAAPAGGVAAAIHDPEAQAGLLPMPGEDDRHGVAGLAHESGQATSSLHQR